LVSISFCLGPRGVKGTPSPKNSYSIDKIVFWCRKRRRMRKGKRMSRRRRRRRMRSSSRVQGASQTFAGARRRGM